MDAPFTSKVRDSKPSNQVICKPFQVDAMDANTANFYYGVDTELGDSFNDSNSINRFTA